LGNVGSYLVNQDFGIPAIGIGFAFDIDNFIKANNFRIFIPGIGENYQVYGALGILNSCERHGFAVFGLMLPNLGDNPGYADAFLGFGFI